METIMTEDEFNDVSQRVASDFIDLYAEHCKRYPKQLVFVAMAGAIASLAVVNGFSQENVVAAINHCFQDIGEQPEAPSAPNIPAHSASDPKN
jgi:hypothetical protein